MTPIESNQHDPKADLVAYLDGELEEQQSLALEAKLNRDPNMRSEADQLKRTWDMLDHLPRPTPAPDFTQRTMDRITVHSPKVRSSWRLPIQWRPYAIGVGWAAGVLVAAAAGFAAARLASPRVADVGTAPESGIDHDLLVRDRRVIENRRLYEHAVTVDFLRALANPDDQDLFGGDGSGS